MIERAKGLKWPSYVRSESVDFNFGSTRYGRRFLPSERFLHFAKLLSILARLMDQGESALELTYRGSSSVPLVLVLPGSADRELPRRQWHHDLHTSQRRW